jgi:hypothetical protein
MFTKRQFAQCLLIGILLIQQANCQEEKEKPEPDPVDVSAQRKAIIEETMTAMLYKECLVRTMMVVDSYRRDAQLGEEQLEQLKIAATSVSMDFAKEQAAADTGLFDHEIPPLATVINAGGQLINLPALMEEVPEVEEEKTEDKAASTISDVATAFSNIFSKAIGTAVKVKKPKVADVYPKLTVAVGETSVNWNLREEHSSSGWGRGGGFRTATANPIWTKAIEENTTEKQRTMIAEVRQLRLNASAAKLCTAVMASSMSLSADQRSKLHELLVQRANQAGIEAEDFNISGANVLRKVFSNPEFDELRAIVSDAQWTIWKQSREKLKDGNF